MDLLQALSALPSLVEDHRKIAADLLEAQRQLAKSDRPMTYDEAAEYLSVSVSTIKNYVNRGWIAATRIKTGHKDNDVFVRILRSDLDDFLRKGRVEARL